MTRTAQGTEPYMRTPGVAISILLLFGFLAFVFLFAAISGGITTANLGGWYAGLAKPALTPANWVFPVVWNFLYLLIAISGWLVWRTAGGFTAAGPAMALFAAQMMFNFAWSVLFFGLHSLGAAVIEVLFLVLAIVATIVAFWRISALAAALLLPYLAWTLFATYLTTAVWLLNR
ncbi:MAG: TspO/MBR family protein [Parvibaculum sp.]|uniref:TspO/MBR family protein n=1 Tax=Parvibaculum sp. TaxID=2024848 RepID=UPI003C77E28C